MTAADGSRKGTDGISTSPAPSRLAPLERVRVVAERRDPAGTAAVAVVARGPATATGVGGELAAGAPTELGAGVAGALGAAGRAGAMPQVSQ
jgi:hypothetical protein